MGKHVTWGVVVVMLIGALITGLVTPIGAIVGAAIVDAFTGTRGGQASSSSTPPTRTPSPTATTTRTPQPTLTCGANILSEPWHLEAENDADERWIDLSDPNILRGKEFLRVTYDLHGLSAQVGDGRNDSAIIFNQPNWYATSLADYGRNGFNGSQTVDIPLSTFISLPDTEAGLPGGKVLDTDKPVDAIRSRFWHSTHFTVDITSIQLCVT